MIDPVDKINKASDRFTSLLSSHRENLAKQAVNAVLLFIILAVFGCFDFMSFTFNFDVFDFTNHYAEAVAYWAKVFAKTVAGICALNIGMNLRWNTEIERSVVLRDSIAEYERLMKFKDSKTFDDFVVNVFNPAEKKKAWIDSVNKKIHRLNRFARHKDMILYTTGTEEQKQQNKYCIRRAELEKMKTDEWVDANIDSLFVKYYPVDPIVFDLDIDGKTQERGAKVIGNVTLAKTRHTSTAAFGIVGASVLTASIVLGADQQQFEDQMQAFWYYFLSCLEDTLIVAWQTFRGILADKSIVNSEYVLPYVARVRVLTAYIDWCAETKVPESKAYRILDELDKIEKRTEAKGGC